MSNFEQIPGTEASVSNGARNGVALFIAATTLVVGGMVAGGCTRPERVNESVATAPANPTSPSPEASPTPVPEPASVYDAECVSMIDDPGVDLTKDDCEILRPLAKDGSEYVSHNIEFDGGTPCGGALLGEVRVGANGKVDLNTQFMPQRFQRAVARMMEDPVMKLLLPHADTGISFWMVSGLERENGRFDGEEVGLHEDRALLCLAAGEAKIYLTFADLRRVGLHELGHAADDDWREAGKTNPETKQLIEEFDRVCMEEARWVGEKVRAELQQEAMTVLEEAYKFYAGLKRDNAAAITKHVMQGFASQHGLDSLVAYSDGSGCELPEVLRQYLSETDMFALAARELGIDYQNEENQVGYIDLVKFSTKYKETQAKAYAYADESHVLPHLGEGGHPGDGNGEWIASILAASQIDPRAIAREFAKLPQKQRSFALQKVELLWKIIQKNESKELTSKLRLPELIKLLKTQYSPAHYAYGLGLETTATYDAGKWQTASRHRQLISM